MKALKKEIQSVVKELKSLTKKIEKIAKELSKIEKAKTPKKKKAGVKVKIKVKKKAIARKAPAKKAARVTASDTVLTLIKKSKKGINTDTLRKKTGINDNNMRGIVYRLQKQGKIKSAGRGIYVKV
jgi:predicted nucleotidyltransferase